MNKPFETTPYFALTLDPVHIGTGGYRLGRVDNTIVREPGTNVPKVPGSSIAGAARAFTAMATQSGNFVEIKSDRTIDKVLYGKSKYLRPAYKMETRENGDKVVKCDIDNNPFYECKDDKDVLKPKFYSCAGKGGYGGEGHCGEPDCPVCVAYGFSRKEVSFQGLAQFYDMKILFFPVYSMNGPVWITCPAVLFEHVNKPDGFTISDEIFIGLGPETPSEPLNFGWLLLKSGSPQPLMNNLPDSFKEIASSAPISDIIKRLYLVSDRLFSRIVNDNLEVRTSVAIDPATGAAEDGALYTYEAIPRATVMHFDVVYNKPAFFRIDGKEIVNGNKAPAEIDWIRENVEKGLAYFEMLGVGGMNTRGFGRLKIFWSHGGENEES